MRLNSYSNALRDHEASGGVVLFCALAICVWMFRRIRISAARSDFLLTCFCAILYLLASPTAILVNKVLMKDYGFHYPVMVSSFGQGITALLSFILVRVCGVFPRDRCRDVSWGSLGMIGFASAMALVLGQYPYLYLTVAFIQMLKTFTPTYMVVLLSVLGVEYPSRKVILCVVGLSLCTCVASAGEINFNPIGISFMVAASMSDALRLVLTQRLLKNLNLHPMETTYVTSPACLLWLGIAISMELPQAYQRGDLAILRSHPGAVLASGVSGFLVTLTSFLLVKRTSALMLKTMTMARNGGLVIVSALVFGEAITTLEAVGYTGLLVCFTMYTLVKANEPRDKPESALPSGHIPISTRERF